MCEGLRYSLILRREDSVDDSEQRREEADCRVVSWEPLLLSAGVGRREGREGGKQHRRRTIYLLLRGSSSESACTTQRRGKEFVLCIERSRNFQ